MAYTNIEIKASCPHPDFVRDYLKSHGAIFHGLDEQTDTYFIVPKGRLKLREGNIENNLIYYERADEAGPKDSQFHLAKITEPAPLKELLTQCLGVKIAVIKKREIYYIDNVKFHIDKVPSLGTFVEIEAGNVFKNVPVNILRDQCEHYRKELQIQDAHLSDKSYSDLIIGLAI